MIDFKKYILTEISKVLNMQETEIKDFLEIPKDKANGDYAFPCFRLAKTLKKSPQIIANEIKEKIMFNDEYVEKIDVQSGYLNIFINKETLAKVVLKEVEEQEEYGKLNIGNGKTVIVEYSSPNIAKPFHIGHLRTTGIGQAL